MGPGKETLKTWRLKAGALLGERPNLWSVSKTWQLWTFLKGRRRHRVLCHSSSLPVKNSDLDRLKKIQTDSATVNFLSNKFPRPQKHLPTFIVDIKVTIAV